METLGKALVDGGYILDLSVAGECLYQALRHDQSFNHPIEADLDKSEAEYLLRTVIQHLKLGRSQAENQVGKIIHNHSVTDDLARDQLSILVQTVKDILREISSLLPLTLTETAKKVIRAIKRLPGLLENRTTRKKPTKRCSIICVNHALKPRHNKRANAPP